tara:strand:- start:2279 stop:2728 length:450 start_codon:yes stop_codon:yes gene_type:complete
MTKTPTSKIRADVEEITAKIKRISDPKTKNNLLRTAMVAGARVIRDRARDGAPTRTGNLKEDIIARSKRPRRGVAAVMSTVAIKKKTRSAYIAHLVEFGTDPHEIAAINAVHPGAKAQPFLRPAIDGDPEEVLDAILSKARERLRKLDV